MRIQIPFLIFYAAVFFQVFILSAGYSSNLFRVCYYNVGLSPPAKLLNTSLCTHIIAGFSSVKDGILYLGDDDQKNYYFETTELKKKDTRLKVMLSVGGGGNDSGFSESLSSVLKRARFIVSAFGVLWKYNFDGLDVDWEFPVWNDNILEDKQNFASFVQEFKALSILHSKLMNKDPYLLSVAVAAPKSIVDSAYNITEIAKYVDFVNLMTYDFHDYFWYTPFTDNNSPLYNRSIEEAYFAKLNTAWSANYWFTKGMPKNKIMVGIPTYGHSYTLLDAHRNGLNAPATGSKGDMTYPQVCQLLQKGGVRVFDNESQVPYAYRGYNWVSYEDEESIYGKAKWIISQGYGGAMTYDLNCDDWSGVCGKTTFVLHRILHDVFTGVL